MPGRDGGNGGQGAVEVEEEGGVSAADLLDYGAELLQGMGKTLPGLSARYLHIRYLWGYDGLASIGSSPGDVQCFANSFVPRCIRTHAICHWDLWRTR